MFLSASSLRLSSAHIMKTAGRRRQSHRDQSPSIHPELEVTLDVDEVVELPETSDRTFQAILPSSGNHLDGETSQRCSDVHHCPLQRFTTTTTKSWK